MNRLLTLLLSALALTSIVGCARSSMASFKDPDFAGVTFDYVAIWVDSPDLTWRRYVEEEFVEEARDEGGRAIESFRIIPPTRSWSDAGIREAFEKAGIEAYIKVTPESTGSYEYHVPQETKTTVERETVTEKPESTPGEQPAGEEKETEKETVTTTTTGGYSTTVHWTRYRIEAIDLESGRTAWVTTSRAEWITRNAAESFADEIFEQLVTDEVVAAR